MVLLPEMFLARPQLGLCALVSGFLFDFTLKKARARRDLWLLCLLPLGLIANGLFTHRGASVLFVLNNSPITKESLLYGLFAGCVLAASVIWFACFSEIMTSDKLLYIFGGLSPKLALVLSMALRYIPMQRRQAKKTARAQKALGAYGEGGAADKLRGSLRVFSGMATWSLENGVVTADSMESRGYGIGRRSHFAIFKWTKADAMFLAISAAFLAASLAGLLTCSQSWEWYPQIVYNDNDIVSTIFYICYFALALLPCILEIRREIKWKSLVSRI